MPTITEKSEVLTRREASEYLRRRWKQRVSLETLASYATRGSGPPYDKTSKHKGGSVFYDRAALDQWALGRLVSGRRGQS